MFRRHDDTEKICVQHHRLKLIPRQNTLHNRQIQLIKPQSLIKIFYRVGINIYLHPRMLGTVRGYDLGHNILPRGAGHPDGQMGQLPPGILNSLLRPVVQSHHPAGIF